MKLPQKILIWDKDGVPESSDCFVIFWKDYVQNSKGQELSIPTWISDNQDFVRSQYLGWVRNCYQILKSNSVLYQKMQLESIINYFQLTPYMEMNLFHKSPQISTILRLIAFEAWARDFTIEAIEYIGDDNQLSRTFQEFAVKRKISFASNLPVETANTRLECFDNWIRFSICTVKSFAWVLLKWINTIPLHGFNVKRWKIHNTKVTFYSYYAHLSHNEASSPEFKSEYWGDLPQYLNATDKHSNWIHLSPSNDGFLSSLNKRFTFKKWSTGNSYQTHVALESFFGVKIFFYTIINWYKIRSLAQSTRRFMISHSTGAFDFWPYYESEFERYLSGVGLIDNLLTFELVKASIQSSTRTQLIFYLYEGQPWEKVLNSVSAYLDNNSPIAVQHSTVRFWDLRYFQQTLEFPEQLELPSYFPKKIVVNGNLSLLMLGERHPQQEVVKLESLRYKFVSSKANIIRGNFKGIKPLILGSFLPEEDEFLLRLMEEISENLAEIEFTFKPHPLSVNSFSSAKVSIKQSRQELRHLLQVATHVLIGTSTSAVIEVIESKIPFAIFLSPSTVNLSPLNTIAEIDFLNTSAHLLNFLNESNKRVSGLSLRDLITPHGSLDLWKRFIQQFEPDRI